MRIVTNAASRIILATLLLGHSLACSGGQEAPKEAPPTLQATPEAPLSALPRIPAPPRAQAPGEQAPRDAFREVHSYLQGLVDDKKIAGAVSLVAQNGNIADLYAVGMQDVEAKKSMSADTIFRICSMSKPITSMAAMILVEEGKIALSDPLSKFVPEFKNVTVAVPDPKKPGTFQRVKAQREITIEDLLTHKSGITYGFRADPFLVKLYRDAGVSDGLAETKGTQAENVKKLASVPLAHQPGAGWTYGLSVDVLGRVIEVASGKTLEAFFDERIFKPLKMDDTHFHVPAKDEPRLSAVYQPRKDQTIERFPDGLVHNGNTIYSASYPLDRNGKFFSGGAGLVSTVKDYGRFLQMLLNGGELEGTRILKKETVDLMTRNHAADVTVTSKTNGDGFGLGFGVVTEALKDGEFGSVGTYSWGGLYNTYFWVDPQKKLIGVVMTQLYPWEHLDVWNDFRKKTYAAMGK